MTTSRSGDRGQTEGLATILLLGITITVVMVILFTGSTLLDAGKQNVRLSQAENSFTQLDSKASRVMLGESPSQEVELGLAGTGGSVQIRQEGWLRIRIINTSTGNVETQVLNRSLGTVVYRNGDTTVAYQGGGVWRESNNASVMISKPEFHYREDTLTFRFVDIAGSASSDRLLITKGGQETQEYPNVSQGRVNPVNDKKISITVHSKYYEGWGSYFEDRTDGGVSYDRANTEVTLKLLNPRSNRKITNAMVINGGGGTLQIQSGLNSVVNSYNSSAISPTLGPPGGIGPPGSNAPSMDGTANITTTKDISFSGNAEVTGNLTTSGSVSFSGSTVFTRVGENLRYGAGTVTSSDCAGYVDGWCAKNASFDPRDPMDSEVQDTINTLNDSNDNSAEPCFSESNAIEYGTGGCGGTVELDAGDYYTTANLQVNGQKLILNTTNGDIRIGVDDEQNIQFKSNANVTVVGDGTVRIYGTKQYQVDGGNTLVWNAGYDAPQFWMYCTADCQIQIKGSSTFVGVVFAPSEPGASNAQVQIDGGQTEVYGAIVGGGDSQLKSNADIHFDRAVKTAKPFKQPALSSISYLHVSVNEINVTDI